MRDKDREGKSYQPQEDVTVPKHTNVVRFKVKRISRPRLKVSSRNQINGRMILHILAKTGDQTYVVWTLGE